MLLDISQHLRMRNLLHDLALLLHSLFLEILLNIEQRLQIPESVIDLRF